MLTVKDQSNNRPQSSKKELTRKTEVWRGVWTVSISLRVCVVIDQSFMQISSQRMQNHTITTRGELFKYTEKLCSLCIQHVGLKQKRIWNKKNSCCCYRVPFLLELLPALKASKYPPSHPVNTDGLKNFNSQQPLPCRDDSEVTSRVSSSGIIQLLLLMFLCQPKHNSLELMNLKTDAQLSSLPYFPESFTHWQWREHVLDSDSRQIITSRQKIYNIYICCDHAEK